MWPLQFHIFIEMPSRNAFVLTELPFPKEQNSPGTGVSRSECLISYSIQQGQGFKNTGSGDQTTRASYVEIFPHFSMLFQQNKT